MSYNKKIFIILLLNFLSKSIYGDAIKCISCASKELEVNWPSTTLIYPKNSSDFFDTGCDESISRNMNPNCPSLCFTMLVNTKLKNYIVRGCMNDFFNDVVISDALGKLDSDGKYCLASDGKAPNDEKFYLKYCNSNECNGNFRMKDFNPSCPPEPISQQKTCYSCTKLYGSGKCKPNSGSTCTGGYCIKVTGYYGEAKFEERGCTNVNPYIKNTCVDTETNFPLSLGSSITANEVIKSTVCYCDGNYCNSSTTRYFSIITFLIICIIFI